MEVITFYTRPGCHLCEDGLWILESTSDSRQMSILEVDISIDADLEAQYGERIPVLKREGTDTELSWPFTPESILAWLDVKQAR